MSERRLIRRELAKQTALLFFVFALLFALLGAGIYSMVSSNIFRSADENLLSIATETNLVSLDTLEGTEGAFEFSSSLSARDASDVEAETAPSYSIQLQQDIVETDPQFITLMRDEEGGLLDTVGLYAAYPAYFSTIPFDADDLDRVYEVPAGGHEYRGITYAVGQDDDRSYMQVLVNVDSELAILQSFTGALVGYLAVAVVVSAAASYLLSRRMLKPIVANWRAQTEFVQNASHELRTPLAVIQATGELLLDHPDSRIVDRFEDVNTLTSETRRLARLVDDLMALSLDDAGRTALAMSAVDVDGLVRDVATAYEDFASMQDKRLTVDAAFGGSIEADADKLRQLLGIVLDNALKYTEPGDEIAVRTRATDANCIVEVADTGCGIDPEDRERVFERFYRADKARSRKTGGHGLGLSLAQRIVEAHGGTITLAANGPRGTVATIMLPARTS